LQAMKRKTAKGNGHILSRNCRLQHAIEGKEQETRRRGRRSKKLRDDLKEKISNGN